MVMLSSFLCNGVIFSIINSYGSIFVFLKGFYKDDPDASSKASLVGSLAVGTTFALSDLSSLLGMISHKKSLITIFGHKLNIKNFMKNFNGIWILVHIWNQIANFEAKLHKID